MWIHKIVKDDLLELARGIIWEEKASCAWGTDLNEDEFDGRWIFNGEKKTQIWQSKVINGDRVDLEFCEIMNSLIRASS